jgi:hypothetical protein
VAQNSKQATGKDHSCMQYTFMYEESRNRVMVSYSRSSIRAGTLISAIVSGG